MNEEEIIQTVEKLVELRKVQKKNKKHKSEIFTLQNKCVKLMTYLIDYHTRKYKKFANYEDLHQDGMLALHLAIKSYEPTKGNFFWWANKYIKTKISREANRHSTIKIPRKKAREMQPFKVSEIPIMIDGRPDSSETMEQQERENLLRTALNSLSKDQRRVIELHYEINSKPRDKRTIESVSKTMKIEKSDCLKLLRVAKKNLKENLEILGV
jgi:RNA polymerase sigma factor (sigma-70 family)